MILSDGLKKQCAKEALKYIKNNTVVGLGGGSTIAHLIDFIKEQKLNIRVVTPSVKTRSLCAEKGIEVIDTSLINKVDIAFDGCDEVDNNLNALKSCGGIHTKEKIIASMADEYILLADETKVSKSLNFKFPVVLEVIPEALSYVCKMAEKTGGRVEVRTSSAKDGYTISDNGNILIDVFYQNVDDIKELEKSLISIRGVIDTSLFVDVVTKAIVVSENGTREIKG